MYKDILAWEDLIAVHYHYDQLLASIKVALHMPVTLQHTSDISRHRNTHVVCTDSTCASCTESSRLQDSDQACCENWLQESIAQYAGKKTDEPVLVS